GDVHAVRAEFVGEVLGQRGHADIADGLGDRVGLARTESADVDDAAPALGDQVRGHRAGGAQVAEHLDLHLPTNQLVGGGGEIGGRARAPRGGGRVHQDVD